MQTELPVKQPGITVPANIDLRALGTPTAEDHTGSREDIKRRAPGLRSLPVLKWYPKVLPLLRDPVVSLLQLQSKYGDVVSLGEEKNAPVLVFGPEYNRYLLTNNDLFHSLDVNSDISLLRLPRHSTASILLSGIASMNGEAHTQHRRMLMPAFHKARIDSLRDLIVARVEEHIARWLPGSIISLKDEMVYLSMSLAISALVGLDPATEGTRVRHLLEDWSKHGLSPQVALLPYNLPGTPYRRFVRISDALFAEFLAIIERKRVASTDSGDALALLLDARDEDGSTLTDDELLGHLATLFTAGHETTASALTWTLFLLTQHPQVMSDLLDELEGTLHGEAPTVDQLKDLPLLDGVVNEGLRMFPPGMWMLRTSTAPFQLGPYSFPERTQLIYSPAATHRRPDIYSQPNKFNPHRWETITPTTYEFLPFGGGPRRCLGATFATLELRLALAIIVQRFRLNVPPGTRVDRSGTVLSFPKHILPVGISAQDRQSSATGVKGNIHALVDFN